MELLPSGFVTVGYGNNLSVIDFIIRSVLRKRRYARFFQSTTQKDQVISHNLKRAADFFFSFQTVNIYINYEKEMRKRFGKYRQKVAWIYTHC